MLKVIQSKDNPKIKFAQKLASDTSFRNQNQLFFASTAKVVIDIILAGFEVESLFFMQEEYDKYQDILADKPVYIITENVSNKLSEDKTSQGVFGIFKMKKPDVTQIFSAKKLLVLEDVQDPANIGAIMRTALGLGYVNVVISNKCADIYSPKVLRSSMTASVKLNVYKVSDIPQFVKDIADKGFSCVATCLGNSSLLGQETLTLPIAVVIGNEGSGLLQNTIKNCTHHIKIPMSEKIESYNAAVSASIIMWQLRGE